ncbi:MAG: S8 family peptidase [Candidatus Aminicenantia bacterium]
MKKNLMIIFILSIFIFLSALYQKKASLKDYEKTDFKHLSLEFLPVVNDGIPIKPGDKKYADDHILVKFKERANSQQLISEFESMGMRELRKLKGFDVHILSLPEGTDPEIACKVLQNHLDVLYAEPDYIAYATAKPNDYYFKTQYYLLNEGQEYFSNRWGKAGADIKATDAWEREKGSSNIIIAVLDTGVYLQHEDLKDKIVQGYDFVNEDNDPSDDHWHGTHVAGIIGASTNNGIGIAGVCWNSKIMPIKVLDKNGSGYYSAIAEGIRWAVDRGAKVINMSLGGSSSSSTLEEGVNYAFSKGAVCVAASGNDRDERVLYPAAYKNCIAVGATNDRDEESGWHSKGPEIDVSAPGEFIASTFNPKYENKGFNYAYASGTSMATPIVSGLAGLIFSKNPSISAKDLMNLIKYTADDVNALTFKGIDEYLGYGRINAATAILPYKFKK